MAGASPQENAPVSEAATNQTGKRIGARFGADTDPREAGRRGGLASGVARRQAPMRELEAKVLESRNGAAAVKLLEIRMRRDQALEREQIRLDRLVCELAAEEDELRELIAHHRGEVNRL